MEVMLFSVPYTATKFDVQESLAQVLHGEDFYDSSDPAARKINFRVTLNPDPLRGVRNDGTGTLILPRTGSFNLKWRFWEWINSHHNAIRVLKRPIRFRTSSKRPFRGLVDHLSTARYVEPNIVKAREYRQAQLHRLSIRIQKVQLGVFFFPPPLPSGKPSNRAYSPEWEYPARDDIKVVKWLYVDDEKKLVVVQLGDLTDDVAIRYISIKFADVEKIGVGFDSGTPFACFALTASPAFEESWTPPEAEITEYEDDFWDNGEEDYAEVEHQRELETSDNHCEDILNNSFPSKAQNGPETADSRREGVFDTSGPSETLHEYSRSRISALDPAHSRIAQYAYQLRLIFPTEDQLTQFVELCKVAGLSYVSATLAADKMELYSRKNIFQIEQWFTRFRHDWAFAFQLESLLYNGLLNPKELESLRPKIEKLHRDYGQEAAAVLQLFRIMLQYLGSDFRRDCQQSLDKAVSEVTTSRRNSRSEPSTDGFQCYHVTFTPTRMLLDGPYNMESNSIVRKDEYLPYRHHFIRVDFRDEDRSYLHFDWAVDSSSFLQRFVGDTPLKSGFSLTGRQFQFLAYTNSALDDDVFWFVHPFKIGTKLMDAEAIRDAIGDFSGMPSAAKYGARLAQSFSATVPSVKLSRDQWEDIDDILEDGDPKKAKSHTDGVGRMSPQLRDLIWEKDCRDHPGLENYGIKPSAYQIRFREFKGVIAVDHQLTGIKMQLRRGTMGKYKIPPSEDSKDEWLHIARSFNSPSKVYLNRDLVQILEGRAVEKQVFVELQDKAVADVYMARDSSAEFVQLLKTHHLAHHFRLDIILTRLSDIGLECGNIATLGRQNVNYDFFLRLREYSLRQVLQDIKNQARIPVPNSYLLVGIADEGPAYEKSGLTNVLKLDQGEIYACVQSPEDAEPQWIKGPCIISRSPTVHPGDVQRVTAVGKPVLKEGQVCSFNQLKNVVVLPSVGSRSFASCLGGGDLDGDLYYVIKYSKLLPPENHAPAQYPDIRPPPRPDLGPIQIGELCDFIVQYMESNILGLLSVKRRIIADQSKDGIFDTRFYQLAKLCSDAVDYAKSGVPVDRKKVPPYIMHYKPDWSVDENNSYGKPPETYNSEHALGVLFQRITVPPLPSTSLSPVLSPNVSTDLSPLTDTISVALAPLVERQLGPHLHPAVDLGQILPVFEMYLSELRCISIMHALSPAPGSYISEEEIVLGVMSATDFNRRLKKDRTYRMKFHAEDLISQVRRVLFPRGDEARSSASARCGELRRGLGRAWEAWGLSVRNRALFGANSFGLIALDIILDTLAQLRVDE